jgi:hypothetical protein
MANFKIEVTPGNIVNVEADSIEEARLKVENDIKSIEAADAARIAGIPYLDNILFDYDKGVKNKKLRRQLARAEKFDEKITVR